MTELYKESKDKFEKLDLAKLDNKAISEAMYDGYMIYEEDEKTNRTLSYIANDFINLADTLLKALKENKEDILSLSLDEIYNTRLNNGNHFSNEDIKKDFRTIGFKKLNLYKVLLKKALVFAKTLGLNNEIYTAKEFDAYHLKGRDMLYILLNFVIVNDFLTDEIFVNDYNLYSNDNEKSLLEITDANPLRELIAFIKNSKYSYFINDSSFDIEDYKNNRSSQ